MPVPYSGQPFPGQAYYPPMNAVWPVQFSYVVPPPYPGQPSGPAGGPSRSGARRGLEVALVVAAVVISITVLVGLSVYLSFDPVSHQVGDCLDGEGNGSLRAVQCTSPEVDYKVVAVIPQVYLPPESGPTPCDAYSGEWYHWIGSGDGKGVLYCLKEVS